MARTLTEIQQEIFDAKNADANLANLNSISSTAIWRFWVFLQAKAIHTLESFFDTFKVEVTVALENKQSGTTAWYVARAKEFQLNDQVTVVEGKVVYAVIDTAKQIITRSSGLESAGTLTLKVAKGIAPTLSALSAEEKLQFDTYLEAYRFAGADIATSSLNADKMRLTCEVFFDGQIDVASMKVSVEAALNAFMTTLPFDGTLLENSVIDAVQSVTGVNDIAITTLAVVTGGTTTTVTRKAVLPSGYIIEDDTVSQTFDDLITYTAE